MEGIGAILLLIGTIGWFSLGLGFVKPNLHGIELPLSRLNDIAVDSKDNIYCSSEAYNRVQIYDKNGKFIRGWFLNSGGGSFQIDIDERDQIHVGTARGKRHYIYDLNGRLVKQVESPGYYKELLNKNVSYCKDKQGHTYDIQPLSNIYPRVVKIAGPREKTTFISTPIYKWLFMAPFPAWILFAVGMIILLTSGGIIKLTGLRGDDE